MSGHSKWSTIKRQKQATDKARGQIFTKLGNAITIAVKDSGGISDPDKNLRLRLAIEKAKAANMPKENVERAIHRALGKGQGSAELHEVIYEGFGPGGIAVIAKGVTDNHQRTSQSVKNVFANYGGTLGGQGSVSYLFDVIGDVHIARNNYSSDQILEMTLNVGGEDFEEKIDRFIIYVSSQQLQTVRSQLEKEHVSIIESGITYKPKSLTEISDQRLGGKITALIKTLEDLEDIHKVYTNALIP